MKYPEVLKLYKYRAYNENSLSMMIKKKIWVPKPTAFNDPFDCMFAIDENFSQKDYNRFILSAGSKSDLPPGAVFHQILEASKDGEIRQEEKDRLRKSIEAIQKFINNFGVYTLSQTNSNILLWSHYADSHKGFCIEFDRASDNDLGNSEKAKPVQYEKHYPVIKLAELIDDSVPIEKALLIKSVNWKYEQEWRLFFRNGNVEEDLPAPISSIIFGLRMPENHKNKIRKIMKDNRQLTFKQAIVVEGKFELDIIEA
jgi:hypothetical protein